MHIEEIENTGPAEAFESIRRLENPFILTWEDGYSYVGAAPLLTIRTEDGRTTLEGAGSVAKEFPDPFAAVSEALKERGSAGERFSPFSTGFAGYFAYGLKDLIGAKKRGAARRSGALPVPECALGLYDPLFVYDRNKKKGYLVSRSGDKKRLAVFREALLNCPRPVPSTAAEPLRSAVGYKSNITRSEYLRAISRAKEYISAGDIYQINISQRLEIPFGRVFIDPFALYLELLEKRPAPFTSFLDYGRFQVISNSPERLLKVTGDIAETSPIKGTRPRGATKEEDMARIEELRSSTKERAEHVMIVDLERNDLGAISIAGSVEVAAFEKIESYPTLHHMVSIVRGRLRQGMDAPTALKAVFPGGSITGAPKIRAMEIIDELEAAERGVYTGGIGWIDLSGDMDVSMAIRTAVCMDGRAYLSVGGGIVADSVPGAEYEETMLKARDFLDLMGQRDAGGAGDE